MGTYNLIFGNHLKKPENWKSSCKPRSLFFFVHNKKRKKNYEDGNEIKYIIGNQLTNLQNANFHKSFH